MKNTELKALIREEVRKALNEGAFDVTNDAEAIKAIEDVAANWNSSGRAHYLDLLNKVIDYLHKTKLGESKINEEITLNSPSFKKLVAKVQEISDKSGNDWDELNKYLKGRYAFFDTYTRGTNPAAYVVNFFSITKGKDEFVKKNPSKFVQVGEWYIRPW
jgi:hypothetical protein